MWGVGGHNCHLQTFGSQDNNKDPRVCVQNGNIFRFDVIVFMLRAKERSLLVDPYFTAIGSFRVAFSRTHNMGGEVEDTCLLVPGFLDALKVDVGNRKQMDTNIPDILFLQ